MSLYLSTSAIGSDFSEFKKKLNSDFAQFKQQQGITLQNQKHQYRDSHRASQKLTIGIWGYSELTTHDKIVIYSDALTEKVVFDYSRGEIVFSTTQPEQLNDALKLLSNVINQPLSKLNNKLSLPQTQSLNKVEHKINYAKLSLAESLGLVAEDTFQMLAQHEQLAQPVSELNRVQQHVEDLRRLRLKLLAHYNNIVSHEKLSEQRFIREIEKELLITMRQVEKLKLLPSERLPVAKKFVLPDLRWERSRPYHELVNQVAVQYRIDPSLLLAVIDTESSFNPIASSLLPALGLMQVTPSSFLNGNDEQKYASLATLLDAKRNIEAGTAYLATLKHKQFNTLKNAQSQLYLTLATYHCGLGNVAKLFNREQEGTLDGALVAVNKMTDEKVYETLAKRSPQATKHYIDRVLEAQEFYKHQLLLAKDQQRAH
jgi:membrane-bound lytic murein transglycosylase C